MLSRFDPQDKVVTGALAAIIAVVMIGGIIGAFVGGGESAEDKRRKQEAAAEKQAEDERNRQSAPTPNNVEADQKALDLITANQAKCQNTYLPNANARADQALKDLREQRAALEAIAAQLPPGKAKDSLGSQIGPGFESGEALIQAELRAATTDCQLAFTVFQLTRETPTTQPE